ncbi:Trichodiene oxygenase [Talaromyces pinophilus]|nr:Trichodiene oxygenase [Talaromyces pinophilus]
MAGLSFVVTALVIIAGYMIYLVVARLLLSPLSRFPGPKLAALSNWYEFYYDVLQQGQFTAHIQRLHDEYGPIIRITPTELHINDPEFFDILYARDGRRHKYDYFSGRFGYARDTFSTWQHELHHQRRKALSPYFSVKSIREFQPVIRAKVDKLCTKLSTYVDDGRVLHLNRAWMALTTDIITEYAFSRSYDQLDSPDFQETLHDALVAIYTTGQFALHFSMVFPILDALPDWLVSKMEPRLLPVIGLSKDLGRKVEEIRTGSNGLHKDTTHATIFHELLNSDLPDVEKSNARLGDEAQLIVAAGLITTSWALSVASFHIISNPEVSRKLRHEILSATSAVQNADLHELEKLPYLHGCVREGIRLAHGITTRNPRLTPDSDLKYGDWIIPRNTPVSMTNVDVLLNKDIYPDPDKFIPERWINDPGLDRYFVPFGKGSRMCLGINLAQAELYLAIATVFGRFDFDLYETDLSDVQMKHAYLIPYPKWDTKGVRVRVKLPVLV